MFPVNTTVLVITCANIRQPYTFNTSESLAEVHHAALCLDTDSASVLRLAGSLQVTTYQDLVCFPGDGWLGGIVCSCGRALANPVAHHATLTFDFHHHHPDFDQLLGGCSDSLRRGRLSPLLGGCSDSKPLACRPIVWMAI